MQTINKFEKCPGEIFKEMDEQGAR